MQAAQTSKAELSTRTRLKPSRPHVLSERVSNAFITSVIVQKGRSLFLAPALFVVESS